MNEDEKFLRHRASKYGKAKNIQGSIIEIGLGWGYVADSLKERSDFTGLYSYETNAERVSDYRNTDSRHIILGKDFASDNSKRKFDIAIIDVFEGNWAVDLAHALAIAQRLKTRMKVGGLVFVEYQSDVPEEREMRRYMEANFSKPETEYIYHKVKGMREHTIWYTK